MSGHETPPWETLCWHQWGPYHWHNCRLPIGHDGKHSCCAEGDAALRAVAPAGALTGQTATYPRPQPMPDAEMPDREWTDYEWVLNQWYLANEHCEMLEAQLAAPAELAGLLQEAARCVDAHGNAGLAERLRAAAPRDALPEEPWSLRADHAGHAQGFAAFWEVVRDFPGGDERQVGPFKSEAEALAVRDALNGLPAPPALVEAARELGRAVNAWIGCEAPKVDQGGRYWHALQLAQARLRTALTAQEPELGDGPAMERCARCDGCGWYEGGKTLKTVCEQCGGTGIRPRLAAPIPPEEP